MIGLNEFKAGTVVDKRGDWHVLHPSRYTGSSILEMIFFGGVAIFAAAYGIDQLLKTGSIVSFLLLLGFAIMGLLFLYLRTFVYYIAINERYVVQGRQRRVPTEVVERTTISYVTQGFIHQRVCGQLRDEAGKVLMVFEPTVERKKLLAIAQELDVPFRTQPRQSGAGNQGMPRE